MPDEQPVHKSQYRGPLVQCSKCGRVVGADQVNTRGRCDICSPKRGDGAATDDDEDKPAA